MTPVYSAPAAWMTIGVSVSFTDDIACGPQSRDPMPLLMGHRQGATQGGLTIGGGAAST